jgi:hypothetical protein
MIEMRLRNKISERELEPKIGKILTNADYNVLLTGPTRILKPDGRPLCVYVPGYVREGITTALPILSAIKGRTDNRGLASGTKRINAGGSRTRSRLIYSTLMGAMDPAPNRQYCRLTSYTRDQIDKWIALKPLLHQIASGFALHVPDRFAAQAAHSEKTHPDWVVPDTPFTTITVNNSYSTGVHTDKGDLDEGFSCLAVARLGEYEGGRLCFPEYRIAADMRHGDLLLMDAHEWHGNTEMTCSCGSILSAHPCNVCGAERISIVCYYRTEMSRCQSRPQEDSKRSAQVERVTSAA